MRQEKSYAIILGLVVGFVVLLVCVCGFFGLFFGGQSFKVVHERQDSTSIDVMEDEAKNATLDEQIEQPSNK